ncbi:hypothetical protein HPP92_006611 [Vanilla planifolia]|uniref:HSP20-like chaperones superfamily protein n=1 Tax=Vanilla planifolia TaxID=51239 RepID=A0A835RGM4_VANPL|nr:hypothetical protein HPP92_006611 [Vanilla planifolia]
MDPTRISTTALAISLEDSERELVIQPRHNMSLSLPAPDINLPLPADRFTPPPIWGSDSCEVLDVGLGPHVNETEATIHHLPKVCSRKCSKRADSIWGAWFFFNSYFKPILSEKSKTKIAPEGTQVSGFDKSDLKLDVFLVQHDMENMYMWVFKEKPENALGKMQLRSYMNGHSRLGEPQFPYSADKGFVRSHRMQRKQYRGLSNPQCIHGIEVVRTPNLAAISDADRKKWADLTGRDLNFSLPIEASDFETWRNLPCPELEMERPLLKNHSQMPPRRLLNGPGLSLLNHDVELVDLSPLCHKRRKDFVPHSMDEDCCPLVNNNGERTQDTDLHQVEPSWVHDFNGVMRHMCGPVTAAKTIYEDDKGYLIMVSLPFADQHRVKVCWRNDFSHGIVKISCVSTARMPYIKRHDRTFKLTDPSPEHCPPGEFVRVITLANRIPEDAKMEAYYDETGTILEIMVPKHGSEPKEHEVHVALRPPHLGTNDPMLRPRL